MSYKEIKNHQYHCVERFVNCSECFWLYKYKNSLKHKKKCSKHIKCPYCQIYIGDSYVLEHYNLKSFIHLQILEKLVHEQKISAEWKNDLEKFHQRLKNVPKTSLDWYTAENGLTYRVRKEFTPTGDININFTDFDPEYKLYNINRNAIGKKDTIFEFNENSPVLIPKGYHECEMMNFMNENFLNPIWIPAKIVETEDEEGRIRVQYICCSGIDEEIAFWIQKRETRPLLHDLNYFFE